MPFGFVFSPRVGYLATLFLLTASALPAAVVTSIADGFWFDNATWDSGTPPTAADDVVIRHNVTMNGMTTVTNLTLELGTLAHTGSSLTLTGNYVRTGGSFSAAFGSSLRFAGSGPQSIIGGGTFDSIAVVNTAATPSDTDAVVSFGGIQVTRILTVSDGQFMPANNDTFRSVTVNALGVLKPIAGATIILDGELSGTTFTGTLNANGGKFKLTSTVQGGVYGGPFYDLEVDSPTVVPSVSNAPWIYATVSNRLTVTDGMALLYGQTKHITVAADGILTVDGSSAKISGDVTNTSGGLVTAQPSTFLTINGDGPQFINGPVTVDRLSILNTAATPNDATAITTSGQLTTTELFLSDGQFSPTTGDRFKSIQVASAGILKPASGSTIEVYGNTSGTSFSRFGGTVTPNGSTVRFTSPTGGGIFNGVFYNVEIAGTAATPADANQFTLFGTISNALYVNDGLVDFGGTTRHIIMGPEGLLKFSSADSRISGDLNNAGGGLVYSTSNGFPRFNGNGPQAITGTAQFYRLGIQNTAPTPSDAAAVTTTGDVTTSASLIVFDGQFSPGDGDEFGSILIDNGGILKPQAGATITVTDNVVDAFNRNSSGVFNANQGTFVFNGSVQQYIGGLVTFYNVDILSTAATPNSSNAAELNTAINVSNRLRILNGVANVASQFNHIEVSAGGTLGFYGFATPQIHGNVINQGTILTNSAPLLFDGGSTQTLTSSNPIAFDAITVAAGTILNENGTASSSATALNLLGTVRRSHAVSGPGTLTGGLTGVNVQVTQAGTLTSLAIDRVGSVANAAPQVQTNASWSFNVAGATGYAVDLTFPHAIANSGDAKVSRYQGTATTWTFFDSSTTASTVTRGNVTDLSSTWAVAEVAGTSVPQWMALQDE